jgi:hypothetical protein
VTQYKQAKFCSRCGRWETDAEPLGTDGTCMVMQKCCSPDALLAEADDYAVNTPSGAAVLVARLASALRSHATQELYHPGACVVCALVEKRAATIGWSPEANIPAGLFVADEATWLTSQKTQTAELLHDLTGQRDLARQERDEARRARCLDKSRACPIVVAVELYGAAEADRLFPKNPKKERSDADS